MLTLFILPAILQGSNPLVVAVVGGSAIMLIALYLCHGLTARTSVAVLGTLASLLLIGLLGSVFIGWALLTGNTDDTTGLVHGLYPDIEIRGLLLAGIIIGSLGVLDDVTVTQTAAVWELKEADPSAGWRTLYSAAMRIGRDHIASVVNTLVLAYAGAALPLFLLFSIAQSERGDGRHERGGRGGDRAHAGGQHRAGRLGAADDAARGAGRLRGPQGAEHGGARRRTGHRRLRAGRCRRLRGTAKRRAGAGPDGAGRGAGAESSEGRHGPVGRTRRPVGGA